MSAATFAISFAVALVLYPPLIRALRSRNAGQVIQAELPPSHQKKAGTPTAGGVLFAVLGIVAGVIATIAGHPGALPATIGLALGALVGFADDLAKFRVGAHGIRARFKLPIQVTLAAPVAALALAQGTGHEVLLPATLWVTFPLAVIAIVGTANAVNLTDGMDGLAGGLSAIALGALALVLPSAFAGERAVALTLCGGLLAFLVFNRHPARVFMGDTGALAIGYAMAAMAIQQGLIVLLPLVGLVFVLETLSVMIQLAYYKTTGGRKIFKDTPIHYTFHDEGWSENRIALSFWSAGLLGALAAFGVARLAS